MKNEWLNKQLNNAQCVSDYKVQLRNSCPNHVVIDDLFDAKILTQVLELIEDGDGWQRQRHSYSSLHEDQPTWQATAEVDRFVQRDVWLRPRAEANLASQFLEFIRSELFLDLLSSMFDARLTDQNVANSTINSNFFRLAANDFVKMHADDSPGREVCMLLYLNKAWSTGMGGELVFRSSSDLESIKIEPHFNRCVLFDPSSKGSEHWVQAAEKHATTYRYNVTSWYWSE